MHYFLSFATNEVNLEFYGLQKSLILSPSYDFIDDTFLLDVRSPKIYLSCLDAFMSEDVRESGDIRTLVEKRLGIHVTERVGMYAVGVDAVFLGNLLKMDSEASCTDRLSSIVGKKIARQLPL